MADVSHAFLFAAVPLLFFGFFIPHLILYKPFGSSLGLAVSAEVMGDIYKLEERGQAMGIFFAVSRVLSFYLHSRKWCLRQVLRPSLLFYFLLECFAAHYYSWCSHTIIAWKLGLVGLFVFFLISLPETYHSGEWGMSNLDLKVFNSLVTTEAVILNPLRRPLWQKPKFALCREYFLLLLF